MKKVFATLTVLAMLTFGSAAVMAQDVADDAAAQNDQTTEQELKLDSVQTDQAMLFVYGEFKDSVEVFVRDTTAAKALIPAENGDYATADKIFHVSDGKIIQIKAKEKPLSPIAALHKTLKIKFIEGGAGFMALTLITLILGLAFCIERIIYLSLSKTNTKVLLDKIEAALKQGGIEAALEVCRNTRGPVAAIFYQGLSRYDEGIDVVEKTVSSYGGVQLGLLEKNLSWISLFISIAPSLGFLGTIIGMIQAFDDIQSAGDISAQIVAGGIKVALLTTLLGLIIAIVLQLFYNYILSLIEGLVNEMEDSSISLLDIVVEYDAAQKKK